MEYTHLLHKHKRNTTTEACKILRKESGVQEIKLNISTKSGCYEKNQTMPIKEKQNHSA